MKVFELAKKLNKKSEAYADILYKRGSSYERLGEDESSDKDLLKSLSIKSSSRVEFTDTSW